MARPTKHHVRLVAHVRKEFRRAVRVEAAEREMTIGEVLEEAFASRIVMVQRLPEEPKT